MRNRLSSQIRGHIKTGFGYLYVHTHRLHVRTGSSQSRTPELEQENRTVPGGGVSGAGRSGSAAAAGQETRSRGGERRRRPVRRRSSGGCRSDDPRRHQAARRCSHSHFWRERHAGVLVYRRGQAPCRGEQEEEQEVNGLS